MFIECFTNNGKPYLRLAKSVRVTKPDGRKVSQKQPVFNIGPLDHYDDGKPDYLDRLKNLIKVKGALPQKQFEDLNWSYGIPGERLTKALLNWQVEQLNEEYYRMVNTDSEDLQTIFRAFGLSVPMTYLQPVSFVLWERKSKSSDVGTLYYAKKRLKSL